MFSAVSGSGRGRGSSTPLRPFSFFDFFFIFGLLHLSVQQKSRCVSFLFSFFCWCFSFFLSLLIFVIFFQIFIIFFFVFFFFDFVKKKTSVLWIFSLWNIFACVSFHLYFSFLILDGGRRRGGGGATLSFGRSPTPTNQPIISSL